MSILAEGKTSNWIMQFTFVSVEGGDLMLMSDLAQSILVKAEFVWLCSLEHESCCLTKAISSRLTKSSTKAIPRVDIKHRGKKISQSSVYTVKSNGKFVIVPRSHHCRSSASLLS